MFLTALPAPLSRIDVSRLVTNLDGLIRMHHGRAHTTPMDVIYARSTRPPPVQMATCVLESPRISKAIVSHVKAPPFFTGVSIVVHPKVDAPSLVSDLRILPTGRTRLYVDVCGDAVSRPEFMKRFHVPLAKVLDSLPKSVKRAPAPGWLSSMSGGCGAQMDARPLQGRDLERVLVKYFDAYLIALDEVPLETKEAPVDALGALFKQHGRAGKYLTRAFGSAFAEKMHALVWSAS